MEFFYSTMPASDIGDYDFSIYREFVKHGLFLNENSQWNSRIPENVFLNYVLYYRINNEAIENCRAYFYDALRDRIIGKSMKEAAMVVNVWCAEHVTYQATDERTVSPLTTLKSSYGRCGEESTMVVTAMRSVGIPARQVYTPRWAHCDDNHAWVEVWCDGDWYFLGACEPEPVLNRGWFTEAAARAMLVDSKSFLPILGENVISKNGQTIILNELNRYAEVKHLTVTVMDSEPLAGITVQFELLNGSEFSPVASIVTNKAGQAGITLGLGSIHIHAVKDGRFAEAFADTAETDSITLDFSKAVREEPETQEDINFRAPLDSVRNSISLTEEEKEHRFGMINSADQKHKAYAIVFYQEEKATKLAAKFSRPQAVIDILKAAHGNFQEVYDFLSMDFGMENVELQFEMLTSLLKKDYIDVRKSILAEHFQFALKYQEEVSPDLFVPYILCPRAYYEQLSCYRESISQCIDQQMAAAFRKQPKRVWEYACQFKPEPTRGNERLTGTPVGSIRSGLADGISRKVLFTAICRTFGIPARINPLNLNAEYYQNGAFRNAEDLSAEEKGIATLILLRGSEKWAYLHNWTIAVLKDGIYQSLELTEYQWTDTKLELSLAPGHYRLITSGRAPNGNQSARKYCFRLTQGEVKTLAVSLRQTEIADMLEDIVFTPFQIYNEQNESVSADSVAGEKATLFVWLEEGREPTEHILNELMEAKDALNAMSCEIAFIIRDRTAFENSTFRMACKMIHSVRVYHSDFSETAVTMARRMYVDPEKLPLAVVARSGHGVYACSGYNVGIADLLIKIIMTLDDEIESRLNSI